LLLIKNVRFSEVICLLVDFYPVEK